MIPQNDIERILDIDITAVISKYIELKKKGVNYQACCPFHGEKTPSLMANPAKGIFKCFGCGKGGNAITFVMEHEKLSFYEACIEIAKNNGITITQKEYTPEEKQLVDLKESLYVANEVALRFFEENLYKNENALALEYATSRFKKETLQLFSVGFAIDDWHILQNQMIKAGFKQDILLQSGLLSESKERVFDFFRNRLIFPIHNKYGRVCGFSGRVLPGADKEISKYTNTPETIVYKKNNTLFGLFMAKKHIQKCGLAYVVEGNTDVMRLHDIEKPNVVGTCGTALTQNHVDIIKKHTDNATLLFDGDKAGVKATIKAGILCIKSGLNTSVLPLPSDGEKTDPDSFFTTTEQFNDYENKNLQPFIPWYTSILIANNGTEPEGHSKTISEIVEVLSFLPNEIIQESYISSISKQFKFKEKLLAKELSRFKQSNDKDDKQSNIPQYITLSDYEKYGFYEDRNSYYFKGKSGPYQGSNFVLKPLFHIESVLNAKRLYEITNEFGYSRVIELNQKDLVSLSGFKLRVESLGNFVWLAPETDLNRLKSYIYEKTLTAREIVQLGWQPGANIYAWGNGIFNGEFTPVNEMGIVSHADKNYYIPAFSKIYKGEDNLFVSERRFIHINGEISAHDYLIRLINVFDNNGLVGFSFFIATLFRDYLVKKFNFFPILNIFGQKGTGKSELAHSLLQLFGKLPKGPNINSTSKPALADHVAQFHNALCHIEEYKNSVEFEKIEFLKGLWDGTGRTRMNMEKDKKKETTSVDCGVILTGQEMPTVDIALFSRLIFITFNKNEFSDQEKEELINLQKLQDKGLTHITELILSERAYFIKHFDDTFNRVVPDLKAAVKDSIIEDRIFRNWTIIVASYFTLSTKLNLPLKYTDAISVFAHLIQQQNSETKKGNELSIFWNLVEYLLRDGLIEEGVDFRFDQTALVKTDKLDIELPESKTFLYINHARIIPLYRKHGQMMKENILPVKTLEYYLTNDKRYYGRKQAVSFKTHQTKEVKEMGCTVQKAARIVTKAMVFDYEALSINLTSFTEEEIN